MCPIEQKMIDIDGYWTFKRKYRIKNNRYI